MFLSQMYAGELLYPWNKHNQENMGHAAQRAELITDTTKGNTTVMICQSQLNKDMTLFDKQ